MTDALLHWDDERGVADLVLAVDDLAMTDSLDSAVLVSLFTDRRAPDDAVLDDPDERGGWWADTWPGVAGDADGSLLWLLRRAKQTQENLQKAQSYARQALAWLDADSIARRVTVQASYPVIGWLQLDVAIDLPSGERRQLRYTLGAQGEVASGLPGEIRGASGTPAVSAGAWSPAERSIPGELRGTDGTPAIQAQSWIPAAPTIPGERRGVDGTPPIEVDGWSAPPSPLIGETKCGALLGIPYIPPPGDSLVLALDEESHSPSGNELTLVLVPTYEFVPV